MMNIKCSKKNNIKNSISRNNQGGKVIILWNQQIQTDRTIPNRKPDIIIRDKEKGTCMLYSLQFQETEM